MIIKLDFISDNTALVSNKEKGWAYIFRKMNNSIVKKKKRMTDVLLFTVKVGDLVD